MEVFIGGLIGGVVLAGFYAAVLNGVGYPDDWETLVVGFIALLSYLLHRRQVAEAAEVRRLSAVAALGHDLNRVCDYASEAMHLCHKCFETFKELNIIQEQMNGPFDSKKYKTMQERENLLQSNLRELLDNELPSLDQDILDRIARVAGEHRDDRALNLLNTYQVQQSRLKGHIQEFKDRLTDKFITDFLSYKAFSAMDDATLVYSRATNLFELPRPKGWQFEGDDVSNDDLASRQFWVLRFEPSEEELKKYRPNPNSKESKAVDE